MLSSVTAKSPVAKGWRKPVPKYIPSPPLSPRQGFAPQDGVESRNMEVGGESDMPPVRYFLSLCALECLIWTPPSLMTASRQLEGYHRSSFQPTDTVCVMERLNRQCSRGEQTGLQSGERFKIWYRLPS